MNILLIIFLFFLIILIFANLSFVIALRKLNNDDIKVYDILKLSIVIAIKNEASNLQPLINSLRNLNYVKDNYEVIIIDDNSADDPFNILSGMLNDTDNIRVYKVGKKELFGKKGALAFGIEKAKYSYIIITDGDCLPQKNWLISFSSYFNKNYDVVFGAAPFIKKDSLINKISCFENLRTTLLTFTANVFGIPYSAAARSFGFTKNIYEKVGGYNNTTETLSGDDDLFLREAIKKNAKVGCFIEEGAMVFTNSAGSVKNYFKQKARHTSTSFYYLPNHKFLLTTWHLTNLLLLVSPLLFFINNIFILFFVFKFILDFLVIKRIQKYIKYNFNIIEIIYLQVIYEAFIIVNFFNSKFSNVKWKE